MKRSSAGMLAASILCGLSYFDVGAGAAATSRPALVASSKIAVVRTEAGLVQGFVRHGILTYRGIPYASAQRFMAPSKVQPWQGQRLALSYGNICPQPVSSELREPQTFISDTRFWPASENCQFLNIWTPQVGVGNRRPVMVWLHGGGFFSGSANELAVYDGTNLARKGVVVVSVNHRLNVLGFLDLSAYGEAYKASPNVGMLDIVAALRWVRDNIEKFGGDPNNVTIFGQSGGGAKVAALMTSPEARGLFAKAIIESGAPGTMGQAALDQHISRRVAELTLRNAGLSVGEVDQLRTIPYDALVAASQKALQEVSREQGKAGAPLGFPAVNWSPVVDGAFLRELPFGAAAPASSKGIPLLVGSTLSEFNNFPNPELQGHEHWKEADFLAYLSKRFGPKSAAIVAAYKKAYPEMGPGLWPTVDTIFRAGVLHSAQLKAAQGDPVYTYLFAWRSPVLDYAWAAGHSSELGLVFDNPELAEQALGGGPVVNRLANEMSNAWVRFARTGNPNGATLPPWPTYTKAHQTTMIFGDRTRLRVGHDADLIQLTSTRP